MIFSEFKKAPFSFDSKLVVFALRPYLLQSLLSSSPTHYYQYLHQSEKMRAIHLLRASSLLHHSIKRPFTSATSGSGAISAQVGFESENAPEGERDRCGHFFEISGLC